MASKYFDPIATKETKIKTKVECGNLIGKIKTKISAVINTDSVLVIALNNFANIKLAIKEDISVINVLKAISIGL